MKPKIKKTLTAVAMLSFVALLPAASQAQGIPVIDVASIVNEITQILNEVQQLETMQKQLTNGTSQLQTQQQQYSSLTGVRGFSSLLNSPSYQQNRSYIPLNWQQALQLIQGGSSGQYSSLSGATQALKTSNSLFPSSQLTVSAGSPIATLHNQQTSAAAVFTSTGQASFQESGSRIAQLQTFVDNINSAPDVKSVMELDTRINAEQLFLTNEVIRLLATLQMQQASRDTYSNQTTEAHLRTASQHTDAASLLSGISP